MSWITRLLTLLQAGIMLSFGTFCDYVLGGWSVEVEGGDQERPAPKLLAGEAVTQSFPNGVCTVQLHVLGGRELFVSINILSCAPKWSLLSVCFSSAMPWLLVYLGKQATSLANRHLRYAK